MSDIVLGENDPRDDIVAEADPNAPKVDPEVRKAHLAAAEGAVLRADDLFAAYIPGVNILNGADLYCQEGELVGIIGPNGAGKSTLLKALFGLVKVGTGTVTLRGDDVTNERADVLVSKGIGFVPQTNNVFPSLTIEENLQMGCYQAPSKFTERFKFVTDLFPALGDRRNQRAGLAVGWGAADGRDGACADDGAVRAPARRAVRGPLAGVAGRGVRADALDQPGRGVRGDGRAERAPVPADLRPGLRARPGAQRVHGVGEAAGE